MKGSESMGTAEKRAGRKFTADQKAKLRRQAFVDANGPLIDTLREVLDGPAKDPRKLKICKEVLGGITKEAPEQ